MTNHYSLSEDYINLYSLYKENSSAQCVEKSMTILKNVQQNFYGDAEPTGVVRMLFHIAMAMLCRDADALAVQFFDEVVRRANCASKIEFSFWFCSKMNLLYIRHKNCPQQFVKAIDEMEQALHKVNIDRPLRDSALQTLHLQKQKLTA